MVIRSAAGETRRVLAVLGPTNTGKTHLAVERLLAHPTGVIGLPLRLLAREIYDRIATLKGAQSVALVTGEEKIVPLHPRWYVCTVESMPLDKSFDFVAIDEIQLIADPERGHVFTERLLGARGRFETMLLGSDTVRGLIRRLVPEAEFVTRPRFSRLTYAGPKKLSRLPRRTAIVAFSAQDVYAIAELVRRQRGGAAVVLGALSPRTRNAQVAMYQNREVDYLVATDAIGMGLNMTVDHVAFAGLRKFDGQISRELTAAEVAQIAGRAGRHLNDGTFGVTAELGPLDPELVTKVEEHRFEAVAKGRWRNHRLAFTSLRDLLRDLDRAPPLDCLTRGREADDHVALRQLAGDDEIRDIAHDRAMVRLLWQVCQIPNFRKSGPGGHVRFLGGLYHHLAAGDGVLPTDWVARHVTALDRVEGDIETLAERIAHIRVWTFVSHRADWLKDARGWQARTRAIEDRLSDALHDKLTQRFVDRRTAVLRQKLRDRDRLYAAVGADGEVTVEGQYVGRLSGFAFAPDQTAAGADGKALRAAANRALALELKARARALIRAEDDEITLSDHGRLRWQEGTLARLVAGPSALKPVIRLIAADALDEPIRRQVEARLQGWLERHIETGLRPLFRLIQADFAGAARGLCFQLGQALGALPRAAAEAQIKTLGAGDRQRLKKLGLHFGRVHVFLPALLKPRAARLALLLAAIHQRRPVPAPLPPGRVSFRADAETSDAAWRAAGFCRSGTIAVRLDILERIAALAARREQGGRLDPSPEFSALAGCKAADLPMILGLLGYRAESSATGLRFRRRKSPPERAPERAARAESPFAKLKELSLG